MARENKSKRDGRRFGRPERLADKVALGGIVPPVWINATEGDAHYEAWRESARKFRDKVATTCVVVADNVSEFAYGFGYKEYRRRDEFPCCAPPFSEMFIEMGTGPCSSILTISRFGWFIFSSELGNDGEDHYNPFGSPLPDKGWKLEMVLFILPAGYEVVTVPACVVHLALDADGAFVQGPFYDFPLSCCVPESEDARRRFRALSEMVPTFMTPALLALCFMNCKGSSLVATAPDARLNRERRKAGLKPFLRYHTIDIEPMKRVLKAEGGVETGGLRKALHICRGHFARYTDSFLGRPLDKPLTIWRPSHVRGSLKEGVVVSDYRVHAPEGDAPC